MNILFDHDVGWRPTAGDLDPETDRRYYAAPPPYRLILVIRDGSLAADDLLEGIWDCAVGDHRPGAPRGYTLPRYEGLNHSKITVFRRVDQPSIGRVVSIREILEGAPVGDEGERVLGPATTVNVELPDPLVRAAREMSIRAGAPLDSVITDALLQYLLENR